MRVNSYHRTRKVTDVYDDSPPSSSTLYVLQLADLDIILLLLVLDGLDAALESVALHLVALPRRCIGLEDEVDLLECAACR